MQDQVSKQQWNLYYMLFFLEEKVGALILTFLALLPADSKQTSCQTYIPCKRFTGSYIF